jgi:Dolichyl-phosphate-mannose-protein mannosyltransferase
VTEQRSGFLKTEWAWGLLLLALGVGARAVFVTAFPTLPFSDFRGILDFALDLRDKSLFVPGYYWDVFNIGPPLALSLVLRVFPGDPEAAARYATAVWCGLMPLLPFLLWRRVLPLWVRLAGGLLLALWPGQVFFSGVLAQENWMIPLAVALACLAARVLLDTRQGGRGYPVAAGLLYALAVSMRQEMLVVLVPPLVAAAGIVRWESRRTGWRPRNVLACGLAVGLPLLALALQRQKVTGHFALSSMHGGFTLLGTVVPGATALGWDDPVSYIASVEPDLVRDRQRMFAEAKRLAWAEVKRRPGFQALRVASMGLWFPFRGDAEALYWSVGAPETLPQALRPRAETFSGWVFVPLKAEMIAIQALFLASLGLGLARRNRAIFVLALAALLKVGLHAVLVSAPRFYMPATALELLVIALGAWEAVEVARSKGPRVPLQALALGGVAAVSLFLLGGPLRTQVRLLDSVPEQRTYRFLLTSWEHPGELRCVVRRGRLTALGETEAVLETLNVRPRPGEKGVAECTLTQPGPPVPLKVEVLDSYAPGGFPGRILQRIAIDGRMALSHDPAAEPGTGWVAAPAGTGSPRRVTVEVEALSPDPGVLWGAAASARIRVSAVHGGP